MSSSYGEDAIVENIEYLDEITNSDEYGRQSKATFYPNALHCLLALYRERYDSIGKVPNEGLKEISLWEEIAKEMQNSYFDFNSEQIRHKFKQLQEKYFDIKTAKDVEDFEYFEQLHDIFKDERLDKLLNGQKSLKDYCKAYNDEILITSEQSSLEDCRSDVKSDSLLKKPRFNDMIKKEQNTINEENNMHKTEDTNSNQKNCNYVSIDKQMQDTNRVIGINPNRRLHNDLDSPESSPPRKIKSNASEKADKAETVISNLTLGQYNAQQERRHLEHMKILQQNLKIQERAIAVQNQLLQELIKRFPT